MKNCTSCGSPAVALTRRVECACFDRYKAGDNIRKDFLAATEWEVTMCSACTKQRLIEFYKSDRRFNRLIGPGLLVGCIWVGVARAVLPESTLDGITALMFVGLLIGGVIMTPIGFSKAAGASARLRELNAGGDLELRDDEEWEAAKAEGERLIKLLEQGDDATQVGVVLPEKDKPGDLKGSLAYEIRPLTENA